MIYLIDLCLSTLPNFGKVFDTGCIALSFFCVLSFSNLFQFAAQFGVDRRHVDIHSYVRAYVHNCVFQNGLSQLFQCHHLLALFSPKQQIGIQKGDDNVSIV